jgi:hypothetical protein
MQQISLALVQNRDLGSSFDCMQSTSNNTEPENQKGASETPLYLLLFRATRWDKGLSAEEIQRVMNQWTAWYERLCQQGKLKGGHPLTEHAKLVSGGKKITVADGPYAESKEAIGGYFLLKVGDFDEAVAIAKECPGLQHGLTVEVRQVAEICPVERVRREREQQVYAIV